MPLHVKHQGQYEVVVHPAPFGIAIKGSTICFWEDILSFYRNLLKTFVPRLLDTVFGFLRNKRTKEEAIREATDTVIDAGEEIADETVKRLTK